MFQVRNSLKRNLIFLSTLLVFVAKAQDTLILEEVQTYYLNGTIKSIEEFKFNKAEKVTRFSKYETSDNSLYIVDTEYDSLNRTIKEESIIDNKVIDSIIYSYSIEGLKTQISYTPDFYVDGKIAKTVIKYNEKDLPFNEKWFEINIFGNGDTLTALQLEKRMFYDESNKLIVDSTFTTVGAFIRYPKVIDGKFVMQDKINPATVTNYSYSDELLISAITIDEYGYKSIENHIRNKKGDYLKLEQISISTYDTNLIITNYSYENLKGNKVQTSKLNIEGSFGISIAKTYFNKKGKVLKYENIDEEGKVYSATNYIYNKFGYLIEENQQYFSNQKPINVSSKESLGYKKIYLYKKT